MSATRQSLIGLGRTWRYFTDCPRHQWGAAGFKAQVKPAYLRFLQAAGLFTPKQLETRTFEMQSHALSIRFFSSRDSALGCIFNDNGLAIGREAGNRDRDVASASHRPEIEGQASQEADFEAKVCLVETNQLNDDQPELWNEGCASLLSDCAARCRR